MLRLYVGSMVLTMKSLAGRVVGTLAITVGFENREPAHPLHALAKG
jgi:hypothetical protein